MEKQKSRLQSEVEVLIIDLEKANNTARDLQKRVEHVERINIELKTRLDETLVMYESSQRDLRNKAQEMQRLMHELEKTREQKDQLTRENKKLTGRERIRDVFFINRSKYLSNILRFDGFIYIDQLYKGT